MNRFTTSPGAFFSQPANFPGVSGHSFQVLSEKRKPRSSERSTFRSKVLSCETCGAR